MPSRRYLLIDTAPLLFHLWPERWYEYNSEQYRFRLGLRYTF
ncbi:hypothetical protein yinte0001_23070 [Yersinia intermedia ATCC 29909]|nr:hypothetical protein yinte0001_23070 [Yersinia intermedia ATCC 29909]